MRGWSRNKPVEKGKFVYKNEANSLGNYFSFFKKSGQQ
jgi:hypothetical protein